MASLKVDQTCFLSVVQPWHAPAEPGLVDFRQLCIRGGHLSWLCLCPAVPLFTPTSTIPLISKWSQLRGSRPGLLMWLVNSKMKWSSKLIKLHTNTLASMWRNDSTLQKNRKPRRRELSDNADQRCQTLISFSGSWPVYSQSSSSSGEPKGFRGATKSFYKVLDWPEGALLGKNDAQPSAAGLFTFLLFWKYKQQQQ